MQLLVVKLLGLLGLTSLMLGGVLLPVRLLLAGGEKAGRRHRGLALGHCGGGGVFLATCFNALLPAVRDKASGVLQQLQVAGGYPLAETVMMLGFFLMLFVEQAVLTFRTETPSFIALDTFSAGASEPGSDSEYDAPFLGGGHRHGRAAPGRPAGAGPVRLAGLVLALSAHSLLEGVALGLQEDGATLGGLLLGVAVHETPAAAALGVSLAKAALGAKDAAKLAAAVAVTIPLGAAAGMGVEAARTAAAGVAALLLQGVAAGTLMFVTFMDVLSPELEQSNDRLLKVLCLVLGYAALAVPLLVRW